jgi:hypothetical protein
MLNTASVSNNAGLKGEILRGREKEERKGGDGLMANRIAVRRSNLG